MVSVGITIIFILVFNHVNLSYSCNSNDSVVRNLYTVITESYSTFMKPVETSCLSKSIGCLLHPLFPSRKRVKRHPAINHDHVTSDLGFGTDLTETKIRQNADGGMNKVKLKTTHNFPASERRIRGDFNALISGNAKKTLNGALRKRTNFLQYINNPLIYSPYTKPIKQMTSTIENPTSTTSTPTFTTAPSYVNEATSITLSPIPVQNLEYEPWYYNQYNNYEVIARFMKSLDQFEREFHKVTFRKLSSISSMGRRNNGISFIQSGLFLQLALLALSTGVSREAGREIEESINLKLTDMEKMYVLKEIISLLPKTDDALKFRSSSRLVLGGQALTPLFQHKLATALKLNIDRFNNSVTPEEMTSSLNKMIENDSGGAMRDTFEEDELSDGVCAVLIQTMYFRPRWRSSPTVLNGTHPFLDGDEAPTRFTKMIRINDIMRYTELNEWDAEAIELFYATPGLSLLILVPRGRSLRQLFVHLTDTSINRVLDKMYSLRVGVTLPLYTLRMTLLLPGKLQSMNITRLVDIVNGQCDDLRLSHAIQRLMFWSEAGRNAFKDDGIEWDEVPELEMVINRPYIFYVRWRNITIINGNFVL